jgi:hypothetical protein
MHHLKILVMIMCCLIAYAGSSFSNPQRLWASPSLQSTKNETQERKTETADHPEGDTKPEKVNTSQAMPVYRPPLRGSPGGRVGGGTRGLPQERAMSFYALAPDHVGLTVHEQPHLYWFISDLPSSPLEFTLIEVGSALPLIEERVKSPEAPGIQCIRLADYPIRLQENRRYKWLISLVPEPKRRSKGLLVGGFIERLPFPRNLVRKLQKAGKSGEPYVYAEEGIWYDALTAVSELIGKAPRDETLRKERASLLEQVGLKEAGAYDVK